MLAASLGEAGRRYRRRSPMEWLAEERRLTRIPKLIAA
jgi:hypothetical protein